MSRHFRTTTEPDQPIPATPAELPDHLVATPMARGLRRLGVGTLPFNIVSMCVLVGLSAAVVLSPTTGRSTFPGELAARASGAAGAAATAADNLPRARSRDHRSPDAETAARGGRITTTAPTTTAAPKSTTTTAPRSTTTAKQRPTTDAELVSTPVSARVPRCSDFTSQPDAQAAFDADRARRAGMDGDGDGVACEDLPGRPADAPAIVARRIPTVEDVLHPQTRMFGVHTPNAPYGTSELASFSTAAGKTPNMVLFFQNFTQPFPQTAISRAWDAGMLPMVGFEPIVQNSDNGQPGLASIANGTWDEFFTSWAAAAKADGRPIAFRFAQEMNGNWYPWSDGRFGNSPGDYVRAWRHLHDLFDEVGADNVIWVWSINRIDNLPDKTLARVYPGSAYVDWVGVSGYLRSLPDGVAPTFDFTFKATLDAIAAIAPGKNVVLTEVGAGTTESNRVAWLASFFASMLEHPEILGFNWFNDFKDGGDWRIQYSSATAAAFAAGVADTRYGEIAPPVA